MRNKSIAQRVKAQVIKKHKEDIGSEEVPKQIYNNNKVENFMKLLENWSAKAVFLFKITGICF